MTFLLARSPELALFEVQLPPSTASSRPWQLSPFVVNVSSAWCHIKTCSVVSYSLQPHGLWPARLLCPWGFSRQEHWSGLPFPSPGDLPNPGIEPKSPASSPLAGGFFTTSFLESPQSEREFMMPLYFRLFLGRLVKFLLWREGPI